MATTEAIDVDNIWRALGPWGRYQWKQLLSYLFICVSWSIHTLTIVFIGYRPNYKCKSLPNETTTNNTDAWREYGQCSIKTYTNTSDGVTVTETGCENGWEYDIPVEQSFVTQWDLVCTTEELAELTQALMTLGMMIGSIIGPSLSDRFGRKVIMVISHIALFGIVLGTSFCESYTAFIVLRILTGAVQQGALAGTTLAIETFPTEARAYTEPIALTVWTTALCIMSPIAFFLRNYSWRYLQLTYALMSAWSVFQWWMLDESLRWLVANGKLDKARQVIKNACKWNKKDYAIIMEAGGFYDETLKTKSDVNDKVTEESPDVADVKPTEAVNDEFIDISTDVKRQEPEITEDNTDEQNSEPGAEGKKFIDNENHKPPAKILVKKYTALDIFRNARVFRVSLILWYTWLTDSLVYYGLYLISSDLYGDRYINFFLSAVCEYPACAFEFWALNRISLPALCSVPLRKIPIAFDAGLGRPLTCMMCHFFAALGLILATIFTTLADGSTSMMAAATAFTLIGKMAATAGFSVSFVFTPEIYPTNLRNAGLGVGSFAGKVGAMIAPFSRNLAERVLWAPGAIFAVFCLGVCGGMFYMPETRGMELPQTMEELSSYYKENRMSLKGVKSMFKRKKPTQETSSTKDEVKMQGVD